MAHATAKIEETREVTHVSDATLRKFIGYHLKRAFNVIQADLLKTLKPFELRMLTYTALVLIVDNPGMRQSQLAAAMDIEKPNIVTLVDELEARGAIVRERVASDRRAYALKATEAGHRLYEEAVAAVMEHERKILTGLEDEALATVIATMKSIEKSKKG